MKCVVIVGGMDMMSQAIMLAKKPHIIIATPGRLVDHLENTKGFNLKALKFLVIMFHSLKAPFFSHRNGAIVPSTEQILQVLTQYWPSLQSPSFLPQNRI